MTRASGTLWTGIGMFLILSGCSSSYRIQVVEGLPREVYLNYSRDAIVRVGDLFLLYEVHRPEPTSANQNHSSHSSHSDHGGGIQPPRRQEKALVEVIRIVDEGRATVRILSGEVADGMEAVRRR